LERDLVNEGEHVVPYTVWGAECKVTLRNKCTLEFHDIIYGARPTNVVGTSWVNYIFEDELGEWCLSLNLRSEWLR
jgi:hypothetical protein